MASFNPAIHEACKDMQAAPRPPLTAYHFVSFSTVAEEAPYIDNLKHVNGGTCIAPAFGLVHKLLKVKGTPKQVDVVFISDGEDSDIVTCKRDLDSMRPLPCHCRLFCVGVTAGFPTNLVSDHLYAKFGWGSDHSAPPVIPLETPSETQSVFRQLAGYLIEPKCRPPPSAADIKDDMSAAELGWAARAVSDFFEFTRHRAV